LIAGKPGHVEIEKVRVWEQLMVGPYRYCDVDLEERERSIDEKKKKTEQGLS
jgi:hypothetical protein